MLEKLFPGLRSDKVFLQDLIKKEYAITNANGNRLNGTQPYDHAPTVASHIACAWALLEASTSLIVLLVSMKVRPTRVCLERR